MCLKTCTNMQEFSRESSKAISTGKNPAFRLDISTIEVYNKVLILREREGSGPATARQPGDSRQGANASPDRER